MRRVAITGSGVVSSLGHSSLQTWKAMANGQSGVTRIEPGDQVLRNKTAVNVALVKEFDYHKWRVPHANSRMNSFLHAACDEALVQSGLSLSQKDVVGLNIGTMSSNMSKMTEFISGATNQGPDMINRLSMLHILSNIPGSTLSVKYKFKGPISTTSVACATGLASIGDAYNWIKYGDCDYAIAGGTQDVYNSTCLYSSMKLQALSTRTDVNAAQISRPFDKERSGFVLGQGAGVVVLEELEIAKKRGANILGEILGYGCFSDGWHLTQPDPEGKGAYQAMRIALAKGGVESNQLGHINCHATSTAVGDQAQAKAIARLLGDSKVTLTALKSYIGHSFGAAGTIQLIMSLVSMQQNLNLRILNLKDPVIPNLMYAQTNSNRIGKYFLKNALGFGGVNCSMLVGTSTT